MKHRSSVWFTLVVLAIGLFTTTPGRAQPATDAIYSDIKDVITELIEREVAENVANTLACYSPDGFLKYFPKTLDVIHDGNTGALRETVRGELMTALGNYVFLSFRQGRPLPLDQFIPIRGLENSEVMRCKERIEKAGGPEAYRDDLAEAAFKNGEYYLPMGVCTDAAKHDEQTAFACLVSRGVGASAAARTTDAQDLLARAIVATITSDLPETSPLMQAIVEEASALTESGRFRQDGVFSGFEPSSLAASYEDAIRQGQSLRQVLLMNEPVRRQTGALYLLAHPLERLELTIADTAELKSDDLLTLLGSFDRKALTEHSSESLGASLARAILAEKSVLPAGKVDVKLSDPLAPAGPLRVTISVTPGATAFTGPGLRVLEALFDMATLAAPLRKQLSVAIVPQGAAPKVPLLERFIDAVGALSKLARNLHDLRRGDSGGVDLVTVLDGFHGGKLSARCPEDDLAKDDPGKAAVMHVTPCKLLQQVAGQLDPQGDLRRILVAARDHNFRDMAIAMTTAAFSPRVAEAVCCGHGDACKSQMVIFGRLAKSLVSYVLMKDEPADAALATRAAFKSATVDVIRSLGTRKGIERHFWGTLFFPTATLRASWSNSYQVTEGDSVRYVATVDWLTFRWPKPSDSKPVYAAIELSLVNGLAPFAEFVTRNPSYRYQNAELVWATLVQPSLGGVVALPAFSNNLALTAGVSLRGAAAFERVIGPNEKEYPYLTLFHRSPDYARSDVLTRLLEVSVGVQYIP